MADRHRLRAHNLVEEIRLHHGTMRHNARPEKDEAGSHDRSKSNKMQAATLKYLEESQQGRSQWRSNDKAMSESSRCWSLVGADQREDGRFGAIRLRKIGLKHMVSPHKMPSFFCTIFRQFGGFAT